MNEIPWYGWLALGVNGIAFCAMVAVIGWSVSRKAHPTSGNRATAARPSSLLSDQEIDGLLREIQRDVEAANHRAEGLVGLGSSVNSASSSAPRCLCGMHSDAHSKSPRKGLKVSCNICNPFWPNPIPLVLTSQPKGSPNDAASAMEKIIKNNPSILQ